VLFDHLFDDVSFFSTSMVVLEDQISLGMVFQILLCQINLEWILLVVTRMFVLAISIPAATSSTMVIRILDSQQR
jgi:hypothetical protein